MAPPVVLAGAIVTVELMRLTVEAVVTRAPPPETEVVGVGVASASVCATIDAVSTTEVGVVTTSDCALSTVEAVDYVSSLSTVSWSMSVASGTRFASTFSFGSLRDGLGTSSKTMSSAGNNSPV